MKVLGVDVGLSGALAVVDGLDLAEIYDMPVYVIRRAHSRTMLDEKELFNILRKIRLTTEWAFLERQQPYAKQGVVSTFNLGAQYGLIRGFLYALSFRFQTISPKAWQKVFGIVKAPNTKYVSYEKASTIFPTVSLRTQRGRILDGRCDAVLIAEYGRRLFNDKQSL